MLTILFQILFLVVVTSTKLYWVILAERRRVVITDFSRPDYRFQCDSNAIRCGDRILCAVGVQI